MSSCWELLPYTGKASQEVESFENQTMLLSVIACGDSWCRVYVTLKKSLGIFGTEYDKEVLNRLWKTLKYNQMLF